MPEPKPIAFVPKWLRTEEQADEPDFQVGSVPDGDPRVITRLIPKDHGYSLPARTVSRIIDIKQDLVYHSARDVAEGFNPNFADLKSLTVAFREQAKLIMEPFEVGSYVIPASLPTRSSSLDPDAVIQRYAQLLSAIDDPTIAVTVSSGALEKCDKLFSLLKEDVELIEVTTINPQHESRPTISLGASILPRFEELRKKRMTSIATFEKLTGRLEALDLGKNEFQLKLQGHRKRVRGSVAFFAITSLRDYLGGEVTLEGEVVRDKNNVFITAYRVVEGDDE